MCGRRGSGKWIRAFLKYYKAIRMGSALTITAYATDVTQFARYTGLKFPMKVRRPDARSYMASLHNQGFMPATIWRKVAALKAFYAWMVRMGGLTVSPLTGMTGPRGGYRLPKYLSPEEARLLMEAPLKRTLAGKRDAAILETIYSAGIRIAELAAITRRDIARNQRGWMIKITGKGSHERMVPVGSCAARAIIRYLRRCPTDGFVFRNLRGGKISTRSIERVVDRYLDLIGRADCSAQSLRHSCATHMLWNGAGIADIQSLLGHKNIHTTQIYTHLDLPSFKKAYKALEDIRSVMDQEELFRRDDFEEAA